MSETRDEAREPRAGAPGGERRSSSIAWRITWGFWWRRLVRWLLVDALVLLVVLLALWVGYARELPASALSYGIVPREGVSLGASWAPAAVGLQGLRLAVTGAGTAVRFFPLGADLALMCPAAAALLVVEALSLLGVFSDVRRVRRRLQPLNALALHAEALGSRDIMDASKIESLEQAIERASVDSPQIKTGVDDLASIEVALNGLLI